MSGQIGQKLKNGRPAKYKTAIFSKMSPTTLNENFSDFRPKSKLSYAVCVISGKTRFLEIWSCLVNICLKKWSKLIFFGI